MNPESSRDPSHLSGQASAFNSIDMRSSGIFRKLLDMYSAEVEAQFHKLGVADPRLIDYLSNLMVRATDPALVYGAHRKYTDTPFGPKPDQANAIAVYQFAAARAQGIEQKTIFRELGDYTLLVHGTYGHPPGVPKRISTEKARHELALLGKRAYSVAASIAASEIEVEDSDATNPAIYTQLAGDFNMCSYGLREVKHEMSKVAADAIPGQVIE